MNCTGGFSGDLDLQFCEGLQHLLSPSLLAFVVLIMFVDCFDPPFEGFMRVSMNGGTPTFHGYVK